MKPVITVSATLNLAGRNGTFLIGPSEGIKALWVRLMEDFGRIEGQLSTRAYGVCHTFDGKGYMDYMAAVEVTDIGSVPAYLDTLVIPARKVAVFTHRGVLESLSETWKKIFSQGLQQSGLTLVDGPQFEVYSEDFDADAGTGTIEIHIPVQ
jgi:AraC family transcriptional regulator